MNSNLVTPTKVFNSSESYSFQLEKDSIHDLKTAKDSRSPSLEENECNLNLISRKTLRGRKEKIPLPKNKLKCEVCLEFSDLSKEDLISCSTCKCLFHKSCNDQFELYENSSYKCIRCLYALKLKQSINNYKCFICGNTNGVLNINYTTKCFYHKICIELLNEFKDLEGEDLCRENIRKWRYKNSCRYCGEKLSKNKAVIKCKNPKCKEYYHIPCAIEKGMIFDLNYMKQFYNISSNDEIPFYCSNHNKKISFMYKTHVKDNINSNNIFKNHLFKNCFELGENDENNNEKTFLEYFGNFDDKNYIDKTSILDDEKIKINFTFKNNKTLDLPIIDEENVNENKNKEKLSLQNKKQSEEDNDGKLNLDDSFENNNNDIFKLDFEKFLKFNEKVAKRNGASGGICNDNQYHGFCRFNSYDLSDCKHDNDFLLSRQNSFDSLPFFG